MKVNKLKNKLKSEDIIYNNNTVKEELDNMQNKKIDSSGNDYIKYSDGTLIIYGKTQKFSINPNYYYDIEITPPIPFNVSIVAPIISVSMRTSGASWGKVVLKSTYNNSTGKIIINTWNNNTSTAEDIEIGYIAIGKWK